jgi:predicted nucleic acid-binding protein
MMEIVIDTSAILAVITHEPDRDRLLALTDGVSLTAPASLPWEVGNAFSSMLKMRRLTLAQAQDALRLYQRIPRPAGGGLLSTGPGISGTAEHLRL